MAYNDLAIFTMIYKELAHRLSLYSLIVYYSNLNTALTTKREKKMTDLDESQNREQRRWSSIRP
jgi:hypothetical protein